MASATRPCCNTREGEPHSAHCSDVTPDVARKALELAEKGDPASYDISYVPFARAYLEGAASYWQLMENYEDMRERALAAEQKAERDCCWIGEPCPIHNPLGAAAWTGDDGRGRCAGCEGPIDRFNPDCPTCMKALNYINDVA